MLYGSTAPLLIATGTLILRKPISVGKFYIPLSIALRHQKYSPALHLLAYICTIQRKTLRR